MCRSGLLRRNPSERLSFDEFFNHPFVDLASAPSEESLPTAEKLSRDAGRADAAGEWPAAVKLYIEALDNPLKDARKSFNTKRLQVLKVLLILV